METPDWLELNLTHNTKAEPRCKDADGIWQIHGCSAPATTPFLKCETSLEQNAENVSLHIVNINLPVSVNQHTFPRQPSRHSVLNVESVCEYYSSHLVKMCPHTLTQPHTSMSISKRGMLLTCGSKTVNMSKNIGIHYSIIQHRELKVSGWDRAFAREAGKKQPCFGMNREKTDSDVLRWEKERESCPVAWVDSVRWEKERKWEAELTWKGCLYPTVDGGWCED